MAPQDGLRQWAALGEARADTEQARTLFDRVCEAERDWLAGQLDLHRLWAHDLRWKDSPAPLGAFGFSFGRFDGLPRDEDAYALFKHAVRCQLWGIELLVAVRDADGKATTRRAALEGACSDRRFPSSVRVVLGIADYERESWVLSGLIPSPTELERLARERQSLGFDPLTQPESLDASNDHDRRSAKRCLRAVIGNDPERERLCWAATPLDELKARGARNGLQWFLEDAAAVAKRLF